MKLQICKHIDWYNMIFEVIFFNRIATMVMSKQHVVELLRKNQLEGDIK